MKDLLLDFHNSMNYLFNFLTLLSVESKSIGKGIIADIIMLAED
jgi:hypothetical protein